MRAELQTLFVEILDVFSDVQVERHPITVYAALLPRGIVCQAQRRSEGDS